MRILILLLLSITCRAQLPEGFTHRIDSINILATPIGGGQQITTVSKSGTLKVDLGTGRYTVVAYTKSARTFEKYMHFSTVVADTIDTRSGTSADLDLFTSQCLLLVLKEGITGPPIVKDGTGAQILMYDGGPDYYYAYVRWTKANQKFTYNPTNAYNKDISFNPTPGKVIVHNPLTKSVTINADLNQPFR